VLKREGSGLGHQGGRIARLLLASMPSVSRGHVRSLISLGKNVDNNDHEEGKE
jgi:hypothetical protein